MANTLVFQVYQIIRKLNDDQVQYGGDQTTRLSVPIVYEKIKRSNSNLNRKSKRLLEDSIERVLDVLREDAASSDELGSIDGEFDGIEIAERATPVGQIQVFYDDRH